MKHSLLYKTAHSTANPEVAPFRRFFSLFGASKNAMYSKALIGILIFSTILNVMVSPFAGAAPENDAKSILRAGFVAECVGPYFRGSDRTQNKIEDIQSYSGVLIGSPIAGHILNQDDGRASCADSSAQAVKNSISLVGYSDILDLLKSVGCTQNSGSTSYSCPQLTDKQIYSRIASDKNIPAISDAIKYYIAFNTFTTGCKAKVTAATKGSADWETAEAKKNNLHILSIVNGDGGMTQAVYKAELANDRGVSTINPSVNWGDGMFNCDTLANMARTYAPDYSTWVITNKTDGADYGVGGDKEGAEAITSCAIEGVGWILCPVLNSLAGLADGAFAIISDTFLQTSPSIVSRESQTYEAWSVIRNIANIAFVIAFLFIIFSQLTGMGITNYGVKKMLPRLAIAAILVNVSFTICQIAIDLSNILGYSINDVFRGIAGNVSGTDAPTGFFATGNSFTNIVLGILSFGAGAVVIYALLSVFVPVVLAAVLALAMILFILIARQALIVMLVVLAPLAFVAYILPNTEKFFKQWRKIFVALLLLFPIIALVFGGSQLASTIVSSAFASDISQNVVTEDTLDGSDIDATAAQGSTNSWLGQIIGAAIVVLPLFAVPSILKKSLDGVPVMGQLANKWGNRANSKVGSKLKDSYRGSIVGRGAAIRKNARDSYRTRKFAERIDKGGINQRLARGVAVGGAGKFAQDQLMKKANAETLRAREEETDDAKKLITKDSLSGKARQELATTGSTVVKGKKYSGESMQRAAIIMQLDGAGNYDNVHEIIGASSGSLSEFRTEIAQGALKAGSKDPTFTGARIDAISQKEFKYEPSVTKAIEEGRFTSEALTGMNDVARKKVIDIARAADNEAIMTGQQPKYIKALQSAANGIASSTELRASIAGNSTAQAQLTQILGRDMFESDAGDQNNPSPTQNPGPAANPATSATPTTTSAPVESVSTRARARAAEAAAGTSGDTIIQVSHEGVATSTSTPVTPSQTSAPVSTSPAQPISNPAPAAPTVSRESVSSRAQTLDAEAAAARAANPTGIPPDYRR